MPIRTAPGGVDRRDAGRLRHPVDLVQGQAEAVPELEHFGRARRGAGEGDGDLVETQRGERRP